MTTATQERTSTPDDQAPELDIESLFAPGGYAQKVIRYQVGRLVQMKVILESDREDAQQQLTIQLLDRLKAFDPQRAQLNTFVANTVRYEALELKRKCSIEKSRTERNVQSLDANVLDETGDRVSLADVVTRSDQVRGEGHTNLDDQQHAELHRDLENVLADLPKHLRRLCRELMDARKPDSFRKTVSPKDLAVLRRRFEQAGLHSYL